MGVAIVLETLDFSINNLGTVEFEENVALESISISGQSVIGGNVLVAKYTINYLPTNTNQKEVTWSIVEGAELGTIDKDGVLTLNTGISDGVITIKAVSIYNESIYATKVINVTEVVDFKDNLIWHANAYWYNGDDYGGIALITGADNSKNFCTFDFVPSTTEGAYKIEIASGYYVRPMGSSQQHPESYTDVKRSTTTYTNGADLSSEKILTTLGTTHWALNIGKGANFSSAISLDEAKSAITFTKI